MFRNPFSSFFLFFAGFLIAGTLFSPAWSEAETLKKGHIVLTGSSTVAPLAAEIGRLFEQTHPGIAVDVQAGGSSRGIADIRRGLADIGMVSRDLKKSEQDLFAFTIALDGITLIIHQDNPVNRLSNREIIDIYRGRIKNWKVLGGKDAPITVVSKAEGHSTLELFSHYFELKTRKIRADVIIGSNAQGIKTVAGNPDAIGYVSVGAAEYDAAQGVPIKLLPLSEVAPTFKNIQSGHFPILRPLNLVTKTEPTGWVKTFIQFSRSHKIDQIVKEQYFVPVSK